MRQTPNGEIIIGEKSIKLNQEGKTFTSTEKNLSKDNMVQFDFNHSKTDVNKFNFSNYVTTNFKELSGVYLDNLLLSDPKYRQNILTPTNYDDEKHPLNLTNFVDTLESNYNAEIATSDLKYYNQGFSQYFWPKKIGLVENG